MASSPRETPSTGAILDVRVAGAIYGTRRLASTCCAALHVPLVVCVRCVMMQSHRGRSMLASCCQRATCMIWCVRCRMAGPAAALDVPSV